MSDESSEDKFDQNPSDDTNWGVLVKFSDYPSITDAYPDHAEEWLPGDLRQEWQRLQEAARFAGITLLRRFSTLSPEDVQQIEKRIAEQQEIARPSLRERFPQLGDSVEEPPYRDLAANPRELLQFYEIAVRSEEDAYELSAILSEWTEIVEHAVVLPPPAPLPQSCVMHQGYVDGDDLNVSFETDFPGYLGSGVREIWRELGGGGMAIHTGMVRIGVVEKRWDWSHQSLSHSSFHAVQGNCPRADTNTPAQQLRHAISTLGILAATGAQLECTGIAHGAQVLMASIFRCGESLPAVAKAMDMLRPMLQAGNILLVEQQALPSASIDCGSAAYIPIELDPSVQTAMRVLSDLGITVVEPAGNGNGNLDTCLSPSPSQQHDSGAIMVGGCDPNGLGPAGGSNSGGRIDCWAWGQDVTTLDMQDGLRCDFGGTSSAAAIIAGIAAVVQSFVIGMTNPPRTPLTPSELRALLRSPALGRQGATVGTIPDLRAIISQLQNT
ncbi:MAG: S8 family serine peptidase [Caldilineaceae bacterium]|nr:S8 family serine peptidase [Caldilineaceae bacterium]